jgi:hypothetical protein
VASLGVERNQWLFKACTLTTVNNDTGLPEVAQSRILYKTTNTRTNSKNDHFFMRNFNKGKSFDSENYRLENIERQNSNKVKSWTNNNLIKEIDFQSRN